MYHYIHVRGYFFQLLTSAAPDLQRAECQKVGGKFAIVRVNFEAPTQVQEANDIYELFTPLTQGFMHSMRRIRVS